MPRDQGCSFEFERDLMATGIARVAGVDEVGRGPLAGPVVAAAVVFPAEWILDALPGEWHGLNDSKALSATRREAFHFRIRSSSVIGHAVSVIDVEVIDRDNILRASHAAMVAALKSLAAAPDHVLVDGLHVLPIAIPQTPIVHGDARSFSIAAASILAKVTRDALMREYDLRWPGYGFAVHKGYPTPGHLRALRQLGPCPIHRRSFAPVAGAEAQRELFPA